MLTWKDIRLATQPDGTPDIVGFAMELNRRLGLHFADADKTKLDSNNVSGVFTTTNGKTVTVTNGRVTSIV